MRKGLKIFLIILLIVFALLAGVVIYVYQNVEQLKQYALKEVNLQLKSELKAEHIDVTVFRTWPRVSLQFNQVSLGDPIRPGKQLLQARNLFLGFNVMDVLQDKYIIQLLEADSGSVHVYIDPAGRSNFDLVKSAETTDSKSKGAFRFELSLLKLQDIQVSYEDLDARVNAQVAVHQASFSGKFSEQDFQMDLNLQAICDALQSGKTTLIKGKELAWKGAVQINRAASTVSLQQVAMQLGRLELACTGSYCYRKAGEKIDLGFEAKQIGIPELLSSLPFTLPERFYDYKSEGKVYFKGTCKGSMAEGKSPALDLSFGIDNGKLTAPGTSLTMDQIRLRGQFMMASSAGIEKAQLLVPELSANLQGSTINGDFSLVNLDQPKVKTNLTGTADLAMLKTFLKWDDVEKVSGNAAFSLTLEGVSNNGNWDWSGPTNQGVFEIKVPELKLTFLSKSFNDLNVKGRLNKDALQLESASLLIGATDYTMKGTLPNFMQAIMQDHVMLKGTLETQCKSLHAGDLMIYDSNDPHESGEATLDFDIRLKLQADQFVYEKFEAKNVTGTVLLTSDKLVFQDMNFKACQGDVSGNAEWLMKPKGYALKVSGGMKNILIQELFRQFDNFGQTEMTAANLNGRLQSQTEVQVEFDEELNVLMPSVLMVSDMSIKDGALLNYEPMNALSKFVDVNELRNLRFSDLKNTITIRNEVITIPAMEIKNNALNLSLSGAHRFDNNVDYKVKLSLSELLQKKRKPKPNEFGEEDEKGKGFNLYLLIKGKVGNLDYTFDRREVKASLKQDLKQEGQEIRTILKQELGIRKDTTLKKMEKKNDNNDELEFEPN